MDKLSEFNETIKKENEKLLEMITFLVYEFENNSKNDLFMLSKLLDETSLVNLITYYGGNTIRIPSKEDYYNSSILSLYFYYTDIVGMNFKDATNSIKKMGYEIREHEALIGKKLSKIRQFLAMKLAQIVEELK